MTDTITLPRELLERAIEVLMDHGLEDIGLELNAVLAQPAQQEPVGEVIDVRDGAFYCEFSGPLPVGTKLYTAPAAQPAQEPQQFGDLTGVAVCCGEYAKCHRPCTPRGVWMANETYLKAQERKPLTDEQIAELFPKHLRGDYKDLVPYSFARAIEQAHGIGSKT